MKVKPFFLKTFGKNSSSDSFVIIYIRVVRRSQEKPNFYGSDSSGLLARSHFSYGHLAELLAKIH